MNFETADQWDEIVGGDEKKTLVKTTWRGEEEGDSIKGEVKEYKTITKRDGEEAKVLVIITDEAEVTVWPRKMLQGLLDKADVHEGMLVRIVFEGFKEVKSNPEFKYRAYKLFIKRN